MIFKCDCETHILKIEDFSFDKISGLSFQIYDIYSESGRKYKKPKLIADATIMNNNYPKEYDKLMKFIANYHRKQLEKKIKPWKEPKKTLKEELKKLKTEPIWKGMTTTTEVSMIWTTIRRADGRIEHVCEHGVGHGDHVHGCDGCCQRKDYPLRTK
jgi:hypothetical protein